MDIKNRVLTFIKSKRIPVRTFEEKSGLSNGYISSMRKGFGPEKLDNVLNAFPELNRDWLLYGEGEMLKNNNYTVGNNNNKASEPRTNYNTGDMSISDLVLAVNNMSEYVKQTAQNDKIQKEKEKIEAEAKKIQAEAELKKADAEERNSRNMEIMLQMLRESQNQKGEDSGFARAGSSDA